MKIKFRKRILLISHEFSNTGAPKALLRMAEILKKLGCFVIVITLTKGEMKEEFQKMNILSFSVNEKEFLKRLNIYSLIPFFFDLIVCNTIMLKDIVLILEKTYNKKVLWWIHEAGFIEYHLFKGTSAHLYKDAISKAKNIFCVSEFSKSYIERYNNNIKVLGAGVKDETIEVPETKSQTFNIICIGELIYIKGQDDIIDAFLLLEDEYRNKCTLSFVGDYADEQYVKKLNDKIYGYRNIKLLGKLEHKKTLEKLAESDLFVLLSRGDSFSMATVEALMLNKIVIISDKVGIAKIIEKENCGFVVKNSGEFLHRLKKIIDKFPDLELNSPRRVFLNNFTLPRFEDNLKDVVDYFLNNNTE